jgi:dihydrolipoamide dehydrogenase
MTSSLAPTGRCVRRSRAAELGAKRRLVTRDLFGGMGQRRPVPVRHCPCCPADPRSRQLVSTVSPCELILDILAARASARVVTDVRTLSLRREDVDRLGVTVYEKAGTARFVDPHTIETESGLRLQADKIILCAGGMSRRLSLPGFELTATHSDAWGATAVPPSMLVIGGGATGVQLASIFNAFGSEVQLFQTGPRILPTEDEDVGGRHCRLPQGGTWCARVSSNRLATPSGVRMAEGRTHG